MAEKSHLGKTRSEWLILQSRGGGFGQPSDAEIRRAVFWFDEDDRREEATRFQTQLDDSRRGQKQTIFWARVAAGLAFLAVVVGVLQYLDSRHSAIPLPVGALAPSYTNQMPTPTLPTPKP